MPSATAQAAGTGLPISPPAAGATLLQLGLAHAEALRAWKDERANMLQLGEAARQRGAALGLDERCDAFDGLEESRAKHASWQRFNGLSERLYDLGQRIRSLAPANLQELAAWLSAMRFDFLENTPPGCEPDQMEQHTLDLLDHVERLTPPFAQPQPADEMLTVSDLERLSLTDLNKVGCILRSTAELMNASEFAGLLEDISGTIVGFASDVRTVAERRKPSDQNEANWRGWTIAAHAAFVSEPLSDIAAKAAQAASVERFSPVTR